MLSSKKIKYRAVDITQNPEDKDLMRKIANNPTALPPQIANESTYCGVSVTQERGVMILSFSMDTEKSFGVNNLGACKIQEKRGRIGCGH